MMESEENKMTEKKLTGYPSIDKPWLKYYTEEAINAPLPECTIYQNIYNHNKNYLNDIALLYFGKKITYRQLFCEVKKAEKAFIAHGVKRGDNVALCVPATPEAIYTILALNKIGANANMLNPTFTEQQLIDRISETGATVMLVGNELYSRVENVIPNTCIKTVISFPAVNCLGSVVKLIKKAKNIPNSIPWNKFVASGKNVEPAKPVSYRKDVPAIMVYSSGTTGASKGIQLTNDGINATILQYEVVGFDLKRQDRYFAQVPIWFSTGIAVTMMVPLGLGITVILEPMYDFEIFYQHIVKYKPHFLVTATALLDYLMSKKRLDPAYSNFKYLAAGGEYVAPAAEQKFNEWLLENGNTNGLHKGYGMCECGGTVTSSNSQCNMIGAAGVPLPHVTVAAFDLESGKELQYGQRGEIRVLSPCKMLGYYKNPEATEKYFKMDENGKVWACTGDMGYITEDGNVYVDGRISDSYQNELGQRVFLFDIERAILSVSDVRQCKVVSTIVDGKETHVAHIVLACNKHNEKDTLDSIAKACYEKLSPDHFPHLIKLYDDALPVSLSGKLNVVEMKKNSKGLICL